MVIERLTSRHDRAGFDCGEESLNGFLVEFARQKADRNLGVTFVATEAVSERQVLGYYTLVVGALEGEGLPEKGLTSQRVLPIVRLARLGVDLRRQGRGLGKRLLLDALRRVRCIAEEVGVCAVVVDALNEKASAFYQRYGFRPFPDDPVHLYMTLQAIRALDLPHTVVD